MPGMQDLADHNALVAGNESDRAQGDIKRYARALRTGDYMKAADIERAWGLYGYTPEIVSTALACVATGLPLEAAIDEATGGAQ